jgi:hypothetical protein
MEERGMSEIDTGKRGDEEISLVDLLVVLLKYRRMILAVVLIGVVAAGGAWLVLRRPSAPQPVEPPVVVEEAEGKIGISFNPATPVIIREGIQIFFFNPRLYYDALREAGYRILDLEYLNMEPLNGKKIISLTNPSEKEEALAIINWRFINNQNMRGSPYSGEDRRLLLTVRSQYIMEILFRHQDPEKLRRFLTALRKEAEKTLGDYYRTYITEYTAFFERYRMNDSPEQVEYFQYRWAAAYLDGKAAILVEHIPAEAVSISRVVNDSPSPPPPPQRMAAKTLSLIIIAGSIFCAVFLAFAVEAVKNIEKDGTARAKIQEALGKKSEDGA